MVNVEKNNEGSASIHTANGRIAYLYTRRTEREREVRRKPSNEKCMTRQRVDRLASALAP